MADVRRAVRENWDRAGVVQDDLVLVAASGGADSMALAASAVFEGQRAGIRVGAVVIEHGLQEVTKQIAPIVAQRLSALGLSPIEVVAITVPAGPGSGGVEAAAREARYEALETAASKLGAKHVLLGHTQNDQAETVLLGLARGSGLKSIAGMTPIDGRWLRPLLDISRATTEAACADQGVVVWDDPANESAEFARVRVRKNALPALESELGSGVVPALARTAELVQEDLAYLEAQSAAVFNTIAKVAATKISIAVAEFAELPAPIASRVLHRALSLFGATISKIHVDEVMQLVTNWHGQKELTVPGARVVRQDGELIFKSTKTLKPGAC
jgi:tRNA(Ile)-lysidine synthase